MVHLMQVPRGLPDMDIRAKVLTYQCSATQSAEFQPWRTCLGVDYFRYCLDIKLWFLIF